MPLFLGVDFSKKNLAIGVVKEHAALQTRVNTRELKVAGACRNRTYQSPCGDLSDFEDRAGHQTRTLP